MWLVNIFATNTDKMGGWGIVLLPLLQIDGLVQDCSYSIANALELLQSYI